MKLNLVLVLSLLAGNSMAATLGACIGKNYQVVFSKNTKLAQVQERETNDPIQFGDLECVSSPSASKNTPILVCDSIAKAIDAGLTLSVYVSGGLHSPVTYKAQLVSQSIAGPMKLDDLKCIQIMN